MGKAELDPAPVWDDIVTFDGRPWRGLVDCVSGGFPCQDISNAGKRAGIDGERSGLWSEFARIVDEVRPRFVAIENVSALRSRGLDRVLGDLAALGYDAEWMCLRASDVGATHRRERIFILAHSSGAGLATGHGLDAAGTGLGRCGSELDRTRVVDAAGARLEGRTGGHIQPRQFSARCSAVAHAEQQQQLRDEPGRRGGQDGAGAAVARHLGEELGHADLARLEGRSVRGCERTDQFASGPASPPREWPPGPDDVEGWREVLAVRPDLEPSLCRMADGMANRVERLRLLGNGVVEQQAAEAYGELYRRLFGV